MPNLFGRIHVDLALDFAKSAAMPLSLNSAVRVQGPDCCPWREAVSCWWVPLFRKAAKRTRPHSRGVEVQGKAESEGGVDDGRGHPKTCPLIELPPVNFSRRQPWARRRRSGHHVWATRVEARPGGDEGAGPDTGTRSLRQQPLRASCTLQFGLQSVEVALDLTPTSHAPHVWIDRGVGVSPGLWHIPNL